MVVISKSLLNQFIEKYLTSAEPVLRWYILCKESDWSEFAAIKKVFPATDAVENDLYVFNVGGNKFRIIVRIIFQARTIFIRFIGHIVNTIRSTFLAYKGSADGNRITTLTVICRTR